MPPVSAVMPVSMVKEGNASKHDKESNAMTFQYFSENLAY